RVVRTQLGLRFLLPACAEAVRQLTAELPRVAHRSFRDYNYLEPFRRKVIQSYGVDRASELIALDQHLVAQAHALALVGRSAEIAFYVVLGAALVLPAPALIPAIAWTVGRTAAAVAHSGLRSYRAEQHGRMSCARNLACIEPYEVAREAYDSLSGARQN